MPANADPSAIRSIPHSSFRIPHSAFRIFPHSSLFLLALAILLLLAPVFRPGRLMSQFHPSRLTEVHSLDERGLGQQGWFSGWDERFQCGYPAGLYQYQFSFLLICALHRLSGLTLDFSYKVLFVAGIFFAAAMFLRLLTRRVGPWTALALTLGLFLCPSIIWQIEWGYWNHVLALGLFCLFVDRLTRINRLDARGALTLAGIYALIVIAHQFTAIAAGLILLGWLPQFLRRQGWRVLTAWLAIPLGAFFLTFSYAYPIVLTRHWMGHQPPGMDQSARTASALLTALGLSGLDPSASGGMGERFKSLVEQWPVWCALLLALSLAPLWRQGRLGRRQRRLCAGLLLTLVPFLIVYLDWLKLVPVAALRQATGQIAGLRFLPYVHFCLFLLAAVAARHWLRGARKIICGQAAALHIVALTLILCLTLARVSYSLERNGYLETDRACPAMQDVRRVWDWLAARRNEPVRVLYESTFLNYPAGKNDRDGQVMRQSTILALSALETGLPQAGALLNIVLPMFERTRTSNGVVMGEKVETKTAQRLRPMLEEGNFGYIVSCTPALRRLLSGDPVFERKVDFGPFTIFRDAEAPGRWASSDGGEPVIYQPDPQRADRLSVMLNCARPGERLLIRQAWHPFWRATINGRPLALNPTPFGLIQARLEQAGPSRIELSYSARRPAWIAINLLALAAWLAAWVFVKAKGSSPKKRLT